MRSAAITFCSSVGFAIGGWAMPLVFPAVDPLLSKGMLGFAALLLVAAPILWAWGKGGKNGDAGISQNGGVANSQFVGPIQAPVHVGDVHHHAAPVEQNISTLPASIMPQQDTSKLEREMTELRRFKEGIETRERSAKVNNFIDILRQLRSAWPVEYLEYYPLDHHDKDALLRGFDSIGIPTHEWHPIQEDAAAEVKLDALNCTIQSDAELNNFQTGRTKQNWYVRKKMLGSLLIYLLERERFGKVATGTAHRMEPNDERPE